jgi:chromosome segregation ATPase
MKDKSQSSALTKKVIGYLDYFREFFRVLLSDNSNQELAGQVQKFIKRYEEQLNQTNAQYELAREKLKQILDKKAQLEREIQQLTVAKSKLMDEFNGLSDDIKISHAVSVNDCHEMMEVIDQKIINLKKQDQAISVEITSLAEDLKNLSEAIVFQEEASSRLSKVKRVAASSTTALSSLKEKAEDGSLLRELQKINRQASVVETTLDSVLEQAKGAEAELARQNLAELKSVKLKKQAVVKALEKEEKVKAKAKPILEELKQTIQEDERKKGELLDAGVNEPKQREEVNRVNQAINVQINAELKEDALAVRQACLKRLTLDPSEENYLGFFRLLSSDSESAKHLLFLAIEKSL